MDVEIRHVTGVAVNDAQQILLLKQPSGFWVLPGGRVERSETPEQAIVRTVRESTGLDVHCGAYLGPVATDGVQHRAYRVQPGGSTDPTRWHPDRCDWFHTDALPAVRPEVLTLLSAHAPARPHLPRAQWLATTPRAWICTAALVTDLDGRLLLVKSNEGRWGLPGGMVDAHEAGPQGAERELREETGLERSAGPLLLITWQHPEPGLDHPVVQLYHDFGTVDRGECHMRCADGEVIDWEWFGEHGLDEALGPVRAQFASAALAARRSGHVPVVVGGGHSSHSRQPANPRC